MAEQLPSLAVCVAILLQISTASAQGIVPAAGASPRTTVRSNSFEPNKPVAISNKIIKPVPLSADSQRVALANIDKRISSQIGDLTEKLKTLLPDELAILTKTTGWKAEDQQAVVGALRVGDPTAVYEAWVKGNPQDTAGAEVVARQTDVKRLIMRLAQDSEKNRSALKQDMSEFDTAVGKITGSTPAVADLAAPIKTLRTWIHARKLIDTATPGKGSVAKLPVGDDVTMVFDPSLAQGTAIVVSDQAIVIGREGANSLEITTGNAAQALGLPIVTGIPLAEAEGKETVDGVLLINPASSQGTLRYNISGHQYESRPGMTQHLDPLPAGRNWTIEFDRGQNFGSAVYTLQPGSYHFRPTDRGWQLYGLRFEVELDNSQSNQEFNFIFQGTDLTVPASGTRTLTSRYPIVVRFDRGNESEFVAKSTTMAVGTLQIGVNPNDNLWDLFPTTGNRREASKLKPFNADGQRQP